MNEHSRRAALAAVVATAASGAILWKSVAPGALDGAVAGAAAEGLSGIGAMALMVLVYVTSGGAA